MDNFSHFSNYSYINGDNNPTGFTNNWLEARSGNQLFSQNYSDYAMYDEHRTGANVYSNVENNSYRDIIKTISANGPVSEMFFGHVNMKHLKKVICDVVYRQSGGKYNLTPEAQSDNELLIVMRYIYLEHAKHLPDQIREQVAELNYQVILDLAPRVMSKAQEYLSYMRDHSQQALPMDRPRNVSSAGTRVNQSVTTKFI